MNDPARGGARPRRKSRDSHAPRKRGRRIPRPKPWHAALLVASFVVACGAVMLFFQFGTPRAGKGRPVVLDFPEDRAAGVDLLAASSVIDHPFAFRIVLLLTAPIIRPVPGPHLLADNLTPAEVLRRLVRLSSRERQRFVVPEGFNRFQIGERLEAQHICDSARFQRIATDSGVLAEAGISGDSAEGYLFPATYDLFADTDARTVIRQMTQKAARELATLRAQNADRFAELETTFGFREREVVTFASIIEKEAAREDELPLIASVFRNRLSSLLFRPARSLQSDPTAAYGCLVAPTLASCRDYTGKVLPVMLRDEENPYNTYRHPGLPPGPIGNPGLRALQATLSPATTDYLFFVAAGNGRHNFSRTLEEHEMAVHRPH